MDPGRAPTPPEHPGHADAWGERVHRAWVWATAPLVRMWESHHPLDAYALVRDARSLMEAGLKQAGPMPEDAHPQKRVVT